MEAVTVDGIQYRVIDGNHRIYGGEPVRKPKPKFKRKSSKRLKRFKRSKGL